MKAKSPAKPSSTQRFPLEFVFAYCGREFQSGHKGRPLKATTTATVSVEWPRSEIKGNIPKLLKTAFDCALDFNEGPWHLYSVKACGPHPRRAQEYKVDAGYVLGDDDQVTSWSQSVMARDPEEASLIARLRINLEALGTLINVNGKTVPAFNPDAKDRRAIADFCAAMAEHNIVAVTPRDGTLEYRSLQSLRDMAERLATHAGKEDLKILRAAKRILDEGRVEPKSRLRELVSVKKRGAKP